MKTKLVKKGSQTAKTDCSAYFKAARKGDVKKLCALIAAGQKVNARDGAGRTALMRVAECGHVEAARALLAAGAEANSSVSDSDSIYFGCNALIFAAQNGNLEVVEMLSKAGASARCEARDGGTPLRFAVEHRSPRMVEILLNGGASLETDILAESIWKSTVEVSLLLIRAGANVNARNDLGQPVLHRAAEKGHVEIVQALIRSKARLNPKSDYCTPLLVAIENGHVACALELIRAGADRAIRGVAGRDALMNAAILGQTEVVRALLLAHADPNARDRDGKTALMLANEKEHSEVVQLLRTRGCDESGYKVQEYIRAAIKGDVERVQHFLQDGVDVNATYQNGAKALISAVLNGHTEVVRLLIRSGVDVSTKSTAKVWGGEFQADALALASEKGHLEIVRVLINAGADVNRSRMFHRDAMDVAAGEGHTDVIRELLSAGFSTRGVRGVEALGRSIRKNKEAAAVALIEGGVKPRGGGAAEMLVTAARNGMALVVRALLDAGVDPKTRNELDETALQVAELEGHRAVTCILQAAGSPQDSPGLELVEAAERGDLRIVHRLILEGADLESRDSKGATALIRASEKGHLAVMKSLIAGGANLNASTPEVKRNSKKWFHHMDLTSQTPLSSAVSARCLPAIELLPAVSAVALAEVEAPLVEAGGEEAGLA